MIYAKPNRKDNPIVPEYPVQAKTAKGPEDIALEFYYGTYWEAVKTAKFYGELASCRDIVRARIDFPNIRDMQRGTWLAEGTVFYPQKRVILVSPEYNPLFNNLRKTEEYFSKQKGLPLEEKTAEEIITLAERESALSPEKRSTLLLPWKCYPQSGFGGVPLNKAAEDELTRFLFKDLAGEYGYKNSLPNPLQGFIFEFKPCEENPSPYSGAFALPLFLSKISNGSHIEVYERDDIFQNWNFAINKRKGVYGIPNRTKERRLRQFGRIIAKYGVENPETLEGILVAHLQG